MRHPLTVLSRFGLPTSGNGFGLPPRREEPNAPLQATAHPAESLLRLDDDTAAPLDIQAQAPLARGDYPFAEREGRYDGHSALRSSANLLRRKALCIDLTRCASTQDFPR